jgi:hypothetical protein
VLIELITACAYILQPAAHGARRLAEVGYVKEANARLH